MKHQQHQKESILMTNFTISPLKSLLPATAFDNTELSTQETAFSFERAIQYHEDLETACDEVIQEQDDLIRKITFRCRAAGQLLVSGHKYSPLVSPSRHAAEPGLPAQDQLATFAPMASQTFAMQAEADETDRIEQWEIDISFLRQRMRVVEDEIVQQSPVTPVDVARKMKFLAGIVADGGEVNMDAFSRLVLEGSDMLLMALGEVGYS